MPSNRARREIVHGKILAEKKPEMVWGWESAAGKIRALRRAKLIIEKARLQRTTKALEIGCGTGIFTELFAETEAQLTAVDISPDLLSIASQKKFPYNNVSFINKRFEECKINGPFDAIIGSSILHHLEINSALPVIFKLLKPGGVMCFTEPNMLNPQVFLQKNISWLKKRLGDSPDETAFFRWPLQNILEKEGFEDILIKPFDWLHPATPPMMINSITKLGAVLEKIIGVREFAGSLLICSRRPLE
jgi:ubiquinone/menaquinone biosynthesis C-methylase UbiE